MGNRSKTINQNVGVNIKNLRIQNRLTQADLARKLNKSDSGVRMWELGISEPDNDTLVALSKIFNVSTDYLLGIEDRPLTIPPVLEGVQVAFHDGLDGLTQEDINDVAEYIEFLRNKRNK